MKSRHALGLALAFTGIAGGLLATVFLSPLGPKGSSITVGDGYTIQVPAGFTIERVAEPENVQYPMMAVLDERGRLFVAESSGKNVKGRDMPKNPECRISVLADEDGDGVYEHSQVFADKLSLPMGALWHRGSLYVASPPDFFRLDDADNDGVSEHREVLLTGWNILNTASLHGPFLGPDGLLYLTHGRHGYKIQTKEGTQLEGLASRIWRCREDGSALERVCGGGFDNPVELAFTPAGEMIGTMTYFVDPQNGQRDALMHFVEGGVYPKPHPAVSEFKRTGDLMPVMSKFARIAPSGLLQYRGTSFGKEYEGNLFTAQFNPHRIQRHVLYREGATFRTEDTDFVTSNDPDFHPTDVIEDADGSLLFLDTGGWYVDACPLSKIAKAERKGAIYRVRKAGASPVDDPRGGKLNLASLSVTELAAHLSDKRPAVREHSLELLLTKGEAATEALTGIAQGVAPNAAEAEVRCAAVFGLGRIGSAAALAVVRAALDDADFQVRIAAARVAGISKDRAAVDRLSQMVQLDQLPVRRQAATSLGQIGDGSAARALLAGAADVDDRFVEHAIIYSLIELKASAEAMAALNASSSKVRKAALIALDQMDGNPLRREQVAPLLADANDELRRAALWVISHHADWAAAVLDFLRAGLRTPKFDAAESEALRETLLAFAADAQVQTLVQDSLRDTSLPAERQLFLLETIERSALKKLPDAWVSSLPGLLTHADLRVRQRTIGLIRARRLEALDQELTALARQSGEAPEIRVAAISALVARNPKLPEDAFTFLLGVLQNEREPGLRMAAAQSLGQAELSDAQLLPVAQQTVAQGDSLTLSPLLEAFRNTKDDRVGDALIVALRNPKVNLEAIGGKRIEQLFQHFSARTRQAATGILAQFQSEEAARVARLRQLEPLLTAGGDTGSGRNIFFGKRAACASCHTIGREGGHVGPDLTSIGAIRSGHDILEAIVFPSATMVPGHESRRVETKAGKVYSGVVSEFESDRTAVVLVMGPNDKVRIPRDDIASLTASTVSLMPDGFATQLTQKELTDLLAFLKAQK